MDGMGWDDGRDGMGLSSSRSAHAARAQARTQPPGVPVEATVWHLKKSNRTLLAKLLRNYHT